MSLPVLEWKKLPSFTTLSASSTSDFLNIVYNMLTGSTYFDGSARTIGSGSAWSGSKAFITGSNTEAILCYPPVRTALSQSILVVGKNSVGASSGGTPTMTTAEAALSTDCIGVGLSKNSGTFTNWTGSLPMGAGSSFSGYTKLNSSVITTYTVLKITIYESKEAIAFDVGTSANPTTNLFIIGGALIDPQQTVTSTEAESDNRIYGMLRSTNSGPNINFLATSGEFLDQNGTTTLSKSVYFLPQQSSLRPMSSPKYVSATYFTTFVSLSGKLTKLPIYMIDSNLYSFLGTLRDIYAIRNSSNNLVFRDGSSNIVGFTISASDGSSNNAILLSYI